MIISSNYAARPLSGLQIVPPALVGVARAAFAAQGINPAAVSNSGEIDAAALIALAFDTIEIRTNIVQPLIISLKGTGARDPVAEATLRRVQPAVIIRGRAGRFEVAPYGMPGTPDPGILTSAGTQIGVGAVAALLGLAAVGYMLLK